MEPIIQGKQPNDSITKENDHLPNIILGNNNDLLNADYYEFYTKKEALNFIKKHKKLKLFCRDKCEKGSKKGSKKFIASTISIIKSLSKQKQHSMYECYEKNDPVKLILDIDYQIKHKKKNSKEYYDELLDEIINSSIITINDQIEKYLDIKPKTIILISNTQDKLSSHIIYENIYFENIYKMKIFMMNIESSLIDDKIIDMSIYKVSCMRMLYNCKLGINNYLESYQNYDFDDIFEKTLLTNIDKNCHLIEIPNITKKKIMENSKVINCNFINNSKNETKVKTKEIKLYLDNLDLNRVNSYNEWIKVAMIIYNCDNTMKGFKLFDEWSQLSDSYDKNVCMYKWNSFHSNRSDLLSIGTLKFMAKKDNPKIYDSFNKSQKQQLNFKPKIIKQNYLIEKMDEKIKDLDSEFCRHFNTFSLDDKMKSIIIWSPYNTGKSFTLTKIFEEYDQFKKILFVSHRRSLSNQTHGIFKKYGITSYQNEFYCVDRITCQIESLHKLKKGICKKFNKYDLLVLDEVESILHHFMSSTLTSKRDSYDYLNTIITNAKKIICLDGDVTNRSFDFLNHYGDCTVIKNTMKKDNKEFKFMENKLEFNDKIEEALENKKNIVIVSMSCEICMQYYEKYKNKYDVLVHTSKTNNNHLLSDVHKHWKKQILIYSPLITSGITFDPQHYNNMFIILSSGSSHTRDLLQMCNRVRVFEYREAYVYLNNIPWITNMIPYSFDEVKDSLMENGLIDEINHYTKMIIYNEMEILNSKPKYFISTLLSMLKEKGCNYEYLGGKKSKSTNISYIKNKILNSKDLTKKEYQELIKRRNKNEQITEDEQYQIDRYELKDYFDIDVLTKQKIDKYYGKKEVFIRQETINNPSKLNKLDDYDKNKMNLLKQLIINLGFNFSRLGIENKMKREIFEQKMNNVLKTNNIFKNNNSFKLYGVKHKNVYNIRSFVFFVNSMIKQYGYKLNSTRKSVRIKGSINKCYFIYLDKL